MKITTTITTAEIQALADVLLDYHRCAIESDDPRAVPASRKRRYAKFKNLVERLKQEHGMDAIQRTLVGGGKARTR